MKGRTRTDALGLILKWERGEYGENSHARYFLNRSIVRS